jgi:hypothetical protein
MEVKGCAEKYIAEEDRLNHRFWLSGCGYVVSLRVVCDAKDCVPRGEQAMRVAVPARLKTTDGKLWVDPSPPLSEAPLDVKMDGGAVVRAGRVTPGAG